MAAERRTRLCENCKTKSFLVATTLQDKSCCQPTVDQMIGQMIGIKKLNYLLKSDSWFVLISLLTDSVVRK